MLAYQQSVFKRYRSDKHFSEFLPTSWRQKVNWHRYGTKLRYCHRMYRQKKSNRNSFRVLFDKIVSVYFI